MPKVFDSTNSKFSFPELDKLVGSGRYRSQLGSLWVMPQNVDYESLGDDETIILLGRKHFITNLKWMCVLCFLLFIPFFWNEFPFFSSLNDSVHLAVSVLWYLALSFYALVNSLMWFYNVYIVTNERLIDLDFMGLLNKTVNVTQISKLEDINYTQRGLMSSFFNYGDVIAETASEQKSNDTGEVSAFTFVSVGEPNEVVRIISELMEKEDKEQELSNSK